MTKRPLRAVLSLDRQAFAGDRRSLRKSKLQYTVVEAGFRALFSHFGRQLEGAGVAGSESLRVQYAIAIFLFFFTLALGRDRYARAFDRNLDVFLLDTRQVDQDFELVVLVDHIHARTHGCRQFAAAQRWNAAAGKKVGKELVEQRSERIAAGQSVCHFLTSKSQSRLR